MATVALQPGFRFHPTDEELVYYYLKRKINGPKIEPEIIPEVDLYKCEPWDLPENPYFPGKDVERYFFSPRDRKYPNGSRTNRATPAGYWNASGNARMVNYGRREGGTKKILVYYEGRAPGGTRTDWVMHEYRLNERKCESATGMQDAYVLCRVFKKSAPGPRIIDHDGASHGAVVVSEGRGEDMESCGHHHFPPRSTSPVPVVQGNPFEDAGSPDYGVETLAMLEPITTLTSTEIAPCGGQTIEHTPEVAPDEGLGVEGPVVTLPHLRYFTCSVEDLFEHLRDLVDQWPPFPLSEGHELLRLYTTLCYHAMGLLRELSMAALECTWTQFSSLQHDKLERLMLLAKIILQIYFGNEELKASKEQTRERVLELEKLHTEEMALAECISNYSTRMWELLMEHPSLFEEMDIVTRNRDVVRKKIQDVEGRRDDCLRHELNLEGYLTFLKESWSTSVEKPH